VTDRLTAAPGLPAVDRSADGGPGGGSGGGGGAGRGRGRGLPCLEVGLEAPGLVDAEGPLLRVRPHGPPGRGGGGTAARELFYDDLDGYQKINWDHPENTSAY